MSYKIVSGKRLRSFYSKINLCNWNYDLIHYKYNVEDIYFENKNNVSVTYG